MTDEVLDMITKNMRKKLFLLLN